MTGDALAWAKSFESVAALHRAITSVPGVLLSYDAVWRARNGLSTAGEAARVEAKVRLARLHFSKTCACCGAPFGVRTRRFSAPQRARTKFCTLRCSRSAQISAGIAMGAAA